MKACFVLGVLLPTNNAVAAGLLRAVQKSSIDTLWNLSFSDMAKDSAAKLAASKKFDEAASRINLDMRKFQHEIPSFQKAFMAEIIGVLRMHEDDINTILVGMWEEQGMVLQEDTKDRFVAFRENMLKGLMNNFRLARAKMATRLPSLYMHAICHAAIRMDVQRKLNGNFLRDLHHGCAGVTYFDAVFTENPLRVLLTSGNVAADKTFGSQILSSEPDVVRYLESLA